MNDLAQLYQRLSEMDYKDMYELEADFFCDFSENRLPWITTFLTISTWFGTSIRSGVWTFYEDWISGHEDYLWKWEYRILIMNKDSIMNR